MKHICELKLIWRQIDHYHLVKDLDSKERAYILKDKLYKFLMDLNQEYEPLVNKILGRELVHDLDEVINLVLHEESMRHFKKDIKSTNNVAFSSI